MKITSDCPLGVIQTAGSLLIVYVLGFNVEAASCRLAEPLPIIRQAAGSRSYFSPQFELHPVWISKMIFWHGHRDKTKKTLCPRDSVWFMPLPLMKEICCQICLPRTELMKKWRRTSLSRTDLIKTRCPISLPRTELMKTWRRISSLRTELMKTCCRFHCLAPT